MSEPVLAVLIALLIATVGTLAKPQPAEAVLPAIPIIVGSSACALLPDNIITDVCGAPADLVDTGVGAIPGLPKPSDVVKDAVSGVTDSLLTGIVMYFANGMIFGLEYTATMVSTGISPDITDSWFSPSYQKVLWLAVFLMVLLFCIKQVQAAKERSLSIQFGALLRTAVFLFVAGGFLVNLTAGAITLIDQQITPGLIAQSADEIRLTFETVRENVGDEIASSVAMAALLFVVVLVGVVAIALTALVMVFRFAILPILVLWLLLAFALNILEEDWNKVRRASLAFLGAVLFPAVVGFTQIISLAALRSAEGVLVTLVAAVAAIMPVVIGTVAWIKISGSSFRVAPVERSAKAMAQWKMFRSIRK